jgi:hypothetical protein
LEGNDLDYSEDGSLDKHCYTLWASTEKLGLFRIAPSLLFLPHKALSMPNEFLKRDLRRYIIWAAADENNSALNAIVPRKGNKDDFAGRH